MKTVHEETNLESYMKRYKVTNFEAMINKTSHTSLKCILFKNFSKRVLIKHTRSREF